MSGKVVAQLNNLRISPRKVRLVVDQIRGLGVEEALIILNYNLKKPADIVAKLVRSALSNARNNFNLDGNDLIVSEVIVNEGKTLKRWMPRAYGRAYQILKRTSQLKVVLSSLDVSGEVNDNKNEVKKDNN